MAAVSRQLTDYDAVVDNGEPNLYVKSGGFGNNYISCRNIPYSGGRYEQNKSQHTHLSAVHLLAGNECFCNPDQLFFDDGCAELMSGNVTSGAYLRLSCLSYYVMA